MLFDEGRPSGAAAEGFQAQRTGAGEQVDGMFPPHGHAQEVENCFANAVFHGASPRIAGVVGSCGRESDRR